MAFELHPRLAADTFWIGDLPLCRLLLMDDASFPWCILVPRRPGLREIYELTDAEQSDLMAESSALGRTLMQEFLGDKLNLAALGNVVPQLHLHHIVRRQGDPAWPAPVFGRAPVRYAAADAAERIARLRQAFAADLVLPP